MLPLLKGDSRERNHESTQCIDLRTRANRRNPFGNFLYRWQAPIPPVQPVSNAFAARLPKATPAAATPQDVDGLPQCEAIFGCAGHHP